MGFQVPKFELKQKRQVELEFHGTVGTLLFLTISAGPITYPFRITGVKLYFDQEANNLLEYRLYLSNNPNVPLGGWPSDTNLLGGENPASGYFGRAIVKELNTVVEVGESNRYLKFAAYNGNAYACFASATVSIQEI